jgi:hypothetical protein
MVLWFCVLVCGCDLACWDSGSIWYCGDVCWCVGVTWCVGIVERYEQTVWQGVFGWQGIEVTHGDLKCIIGSFLTVKQVLWWI